MAINKLSIPSRRTSKAKTKKPASANRSPEQVLKEMESRPLKREVVDAAQLDLIRAGQRININDVFTKIMKPGGAIQTLQDANIAATTTTLRHLATDSICSGRYAQAQRYLSALMEISKRKL